MALTKGMAHFGLLLCGLCIGSMAQDNWLAEPGRGEEWLRWDERHRRAFIYAFTFGHHRGRSEACSAADNLAGLPAYDPKDTVWVRCMAKTSKFGRDLDEYEEIITQVYHRYPEDRFVPAHYILQHLHDGNKLGVEQIHELIQSSGIGYKTPHRPPPLK